MDIRRKRALRFSVYGTLGLGVLFVFLNPYTRQSLFGPTVRGEPFCDWQQRFRHSCTGRNSDTWLTKAMGWVGLKRQESEPWPNDPASDLHAVLLSLVDDPNRDVRAAVAAELRRYPPSVETGKALIALLDDPCAPVRAEATYALCSPQHRYDAAVPKLRDFLDDEDDLCRITAAAFFCRPGAARDEHAHQILLGGLHSPSRLARAMATVGLSAVVKDFPDSFAPLASAARNDVDVRRDFICFAGQFGPVALPVLVDFLDDGEAFVRWNAARCLGELGADAKVAVPALVRTLQDSDLTTRNLAYDALSRIDPVRYPPKDAP